MCPDVPYFINMLSIECQIILLSLDDFTRQGESIYCHFHALLTLYVANAP
jgi:hypothetical protein